MSATGQRGAKGRLKGSVTQGEIERVMGLEAERQVSNYSPGWTYYRAREQRLLLAYEHTLGSYAESSAKEYAPHRGRPLRQSEPLLAVEMMPDNCALKSARQTVPAERWRRISASVAKWAGGRCEVCLGMGRKYAVGCHALFDHDQHSGVQTLTGFIALCPGCAEGRYIRISEKKGRYETAYKRLLMINRWTPEEVDIHIAQAEALRERRSRIKWAQDFSLAEKIFVDHYGVQAE